MRAYLMSGRAPPVLSCIRTGVRLEGASDERPGVTTCRSLWAELSALKHAPAAVAQQAGSTASVAAFALSDATASGGAEGNYKPGTMHQSPMRRKSAGDAPSGSPGGEGGVFGGLFSK